MSKSPSPDELARRIDLLRARGVPEVFADDIARRQPSLVTSGVLSLVPLFAMVGLLWLFLNFLFAHMWRVGAQSAATDGAWFHRLDVGNLMPWIVVLIFAVVLASGWTYSRMVEAVRPSPKANVAASALQTAFPGIFGRPIEWLIRRSVRAAQACDNENAFLAKIARHQTKWWRNATLILAVPSALGLATTHGDHLTVGPRGIVRHTLLSKQHMLWSEVSKVELGCNHTEDSEFLNYEVYFGDWSTDLAYREGNGFAPAKIEPQQVLLDIEKVDAALPEDTARTRWSWLARDPMSPTCISYWTKAGGKNGAERLARLLRTN